MALTSGTRLGPYEIVSPLGAGGMGEVYRARDSRLDRDVAIKVVRADRAASEGSRERFEREARAVAALSHPNILDIHDVGTADGRIYAVMELLDGETLRARLERGPLSWRKAVEIGAAIADGLGAAHAKGMVHRDLKPANVFLTADGRVKVLDFGLARLCEPAGADPLSSPTLSQTDPGAALGTVGYMSPEQVAGTAVTAPSDLFALGCVLQEMVTGQRIFARRTPAETMAAILNEDPAEIVVDAPLELRRSIARCLEKDPDARFQSARDLAFHLRALLDPAASGRAPAPSANGSTKRRRAVWLAGSAAAVIALVMLGLFWRTAPQAAPSAVQSYLRPPDGTVVIAAAGIPVRAGAIAVSPDGQQLVFTASQRDGKPWLWVQRFNSLAARRLEGTEDAGGPFWSPDSRSIGFSASNQLKSIAISGGPPRILGETKTPSYSFAGGDWSPTGDIVFGQYYQALLRLPPSGGAPVLATELDRLRGDTYHCCPAFLPDGRRFLYFVLGGEPRANGNLPRLSGFEGIDVPAAVHGEGRICSTGSSALPSRRRPHGRVLRWRAAAAKPSAWRAWLFWVAASPSASYTRTRHSSQVDSTRSVSRSTSTTREEESAPSARSTATVGSSPTQPDSSGATTRASGRAVVRGTSRGGYRLTRAVTASAAPLIRRAACRRRRAPCRGRPPGPRTGAPARSPRPPGARSPTRAPGGSTSPTRGERATRGRRARPRPRGPRARRENGK